MAASVKTAISSQSKRLQVSGNIKGIAPPVNGYKPKR